MIPQALTAALALLDSLPAEYKAAAYQEGAKLLAKLHHNGHLSDEELGEWHAIVMRAERGARRD